VPAVPASLAGNATSAPTMIVLLWVREGDARALGQFAARGSGAAEWFAPLVVLTNAPLADRRGPTEWRSDASWLGCERLSRLLDAAPTVRRRVPSVLGVRDLEPLLDEEAGECSGWDEAAARDLARTFVPTRAYLRTLETLERHRFAVLTGPPEMGKTAIARTVGLALATEGWQVHECIGPDQVRDAFDAERPQLFVADDAFGSTEYRPDAAERWALELDGILRRLDERHWLIWTSRPAPLKAGLGRIHREHGVERFPQPAEVHVDASALDLEEKTLILFRHTRAADLGRMAIHIVRDYGPTIVERPHFTPGRIGRFAQTRLPRLAAGDLREQAYLRGQHGALRAAIEAEIGEPTAAMAASLRALEPHHRVLLVAMVDQPPGPVAERELASAARRHAPTGLPRAPGELVDRLTDHFLRVIPPTSLTWVHPSWRDLVIDDVVADATARRSFLRSCSLDGLLLALSHGGGAAGARTLPLLVDDADWDAAAERIHELVPELANDQLMRLLTALEAALERADRRASDELRAMAALTLKRMAQGWLNRGLALPDERVLEKWIELTRQVPDASPAEVPSTLWQRTVPPAVVPYSMTAAERYLRWLRLASILAAESPDTLATHGFPDEYIAQIEALLRVIPTAAIVEASGSLRATLSECFEIVAALVPAREGRASQLALALRRRAPAPATPQPEAWTPEPPLPASASLVRRILADLG
jgi:hypothetical protein